MSIINLIGRWTVALAIVGAGLVLPIGSTPATAAAAGAYAPAASPQPPTTRPPAPGGDNYRWGVDWDVLKAGDPTIADVKDNATGWYRAIFQCAGRDGEINCGSERTWVNRSSAGSGSADGQGNGSPRWVRPTVCTLDDPRITMGSGTFQNDKLATSVVCEAKPVAPGGIVEDADAVTGSMAMTYFGPQNNVTMNEGGYVLCATTPWSTSQTKRLVQMAGGQSMGVSSQATDGQVVRVGGTDWGGTAATGNQTVTRGNCRYIVELTTFICVWPEAKTGTFKSLGTENPPGAVKPPKCNVYTWSAERWFAKKPPGAFDNIPIDGRICADKTAHADCPYIALPQTVDGSDFTQVCGAISTFVSPTGWDAFLNWIPALVTYWQHHIGLYARCLTVPINGLDRGYWVDNEWKTSAFGIVLDALMGAAQGLNLQSAGSCGLIVQPLPMLGNVKLNTCEIPYEIANPIKSALLIMIMFPFAMWYARSIIMQIVGFINKKSPVPGERDGD